MLKIRAEYDRDTTSAKFKNIRRQLPGSLLGVSAGVRRRGLVDESGMTRTQMGKHSRSENDHSAWDAVHGL
jgi:hypothetical protein